jgi:hypothetical protein
MAVQTEGRYAGEFILSEAQGWRSRKNVYITAGTLTPGAVLGRAEVGSEDAGNTGAATIGGITVDDALPDGVYTATATSAGATAAFDVVGPTGVAFGSGAIGTEFDAGGLVFTITDGAPDAAIGDKWYVTVSHIELDPAGTDGEAVAVGILYDAVDASTAPVWGVAVVREAEVMKDALAFEATITVVEKEQAYTELFDNQIILIDAA